MLFERTGMEDAEHTLVLTNVVNGNRSVVDIDFIRFTRSTPLYVWRLVLSERALLN